MRKKFLFILISSIIIGNFLYGQTNFDSFKEAFTINDFFKRKVLESELKNNIWFLEKDKKADPYWELYHESEMYAFEYAGIKTKYFANLQVGGVVRFENTEDDIDEWDFTLSQTALYLLGNMNYITSVTGLFPIMEIPFPYLSQFTEATMNTLTGIIFKFGRLHDPLLEVYTGVSFDLQLTRDIVYLKDIDNKVYVNLRSPRFMGFLEMIRDADFGSISQLFDLARLGIHVSPQITDAAEDTFRLIKTARMFYEQDNVNKKRYFALDCTKLLGFIDLHGKGLLEIPRFELSESVVYGTAGIHLFFNFDKELSTVYQSGIDFAAGVSYYNFMNDPYVKADFSSTLEEGYGYYGELIFQTPLSMSMDFFVLLYDFNTYLLALLGGDKNDKTRTWNKVESDWEHIDWKLKNNQYYGGSFSRVSIGISYNAPSILRKYTFAKDQTRVYVKMNIFY